MRTAEISGVQGLWEAVGEPLKSLKPRDLGGAWPSYVERPAPEARVLEGTSGSGLLCRGLTAQPPALSSQAWWGLLGIRRDRDLALGSKLWLLLLEEK